MTDFEKTIAEVLDLSKPVSDCPECGGLGEIRSLGSRRKCECLYVRVKTLKRELDRRDEENRKLRKERDKLIEGLWKLARTNAENFAEIREWKAAQSDSDLTDIDWYNHIARDILREIGVKDV